MSNFSIGNDFQNILNRLLQSIPDDLDKRQGSIIYDALAPAAAELAQCYIALDVYSDQTYLLTAMGKNLDNRVADYGITRNKATYAERTITVYDTEHQLMNVEIGSRFSVPNSFGGHNFILTKQIGTGSFIGTCETAGSIGNEYIGELLPLVSINNLGSVVISTITKPGEDEEDDEHLRDRVLTKINQEAFSGNKAAYKQLVESIEGVGFCKIFPIWNGGGTVKISIVTPEYKIPSEELITEIQELIDPIKYQGQGIGMAPIGHTVTIEAPNTLNINISANLLLQEGYEIEQLKSSIYEKIENYIREVQNEWSDSDTLIIYNSKIIASILTIPQVKNVSSLTINGNSADLTISINSTEVDFPILNEVILNAN